MGVPAPHIVFRTVDEIPDLYGMKLAGDCLEPLLMDGDEVVFSKSEPIEVGDFACLILRPELVAPGGFQSRIKRVTITLPVHVTLPFREHPESEVHAAVAAEQLNPPRTYMIRAERLLAIHKFIRVQKRECRA